MQNSFQVFDYELISRNSFNNRKHFNFYRLNLNALKFAWGWRHFIYKQIAYFYLKANQIVAEQELTCHQKIVLTLTRFN